MISAGCVRLSVLLGLWSGLTACQGAPPPGVPSTCLDLAQSAPTHSRDGLPVYGYRVAARLPHAADAFTQGLLYAEGHFYESTGQWGHSRLRMVDPVSGRVEAQRRLEARYFGEGLARLDRRLWQLSWRSGRGWIYRFPDLKLVGTFQYPGEGWGLSDWDDALVFSNGSADLVFRQPPEMTEIRRVTVRDGCGPVVRLNELERVGPRLWANLWQSDFIALIDPENGRVTGWLDLRGLSPAGRRAGVLNGIAYDRTGDRLFITGKHWPELFQIELIEPDRETGVLGQARPRGQGSASDPLRGVAFRPLSPGLSLAVSCPFFLCPFPRNPAHAPATRRARCVPLPPCASAGGPAPTGASGDWGIRRISASGQDLPAPESA